MTKFRVRVYGSADWDYITISGDNHASLALLTMQFFSDRGLHVQVEQGFGFVNFE